MLSRTKLLFLFVSCTCFQKYAECSISLCCGLGLGLGVRLGWVDLRLGEVGWVPVDCVSKLFDIFILVCCCCFSHTESGKTQLRSS